VVSVGISVGISSTILDGEAGVTRQLEFFLVDSNESEGWTLGLCEGAEDDEG